MLKRMLLMALVLAVVMGAIFGTRFYQFSQMGARFGAPPPVTISSAFTQADTWQPYLRAIGTLKAFQGITISAELDGNADEILFTSGQPVAKGELLVQQADSVEQADLKSFQAQLLLAKTNYRRDKALFAKRAISQNTLDNSKSRLDEALAAVERTEATIAKKAIKAPFAGTVGISMIDPGHYLSGGDQVVSLMDTQSLKVDFNLPGQDFPSLYVGQPIEALVDAYPGKRFPGTISAIDAKVDPNTRNILVRAQLPNPEERLVPGMFADLTIFAKTSDEVIVVPQTAISYSLYGDSIFVLTETEEKTRDEQPVFTVERVYVQVLQQQDGLVAIEGLDVGQQVATAGQLKLNNGTRVVVNNEI